MRNASGHQGNNERQLKKANRNTCRISSIKFVTNKFHVLVVQNNGKEMCILGDPGAYKGDEGKSKRAEKYIWNEEKQGTARRAPGDNVLPDQFQTVAAVLASDWCQKNTNFLAPIRSQNGGDRLELVW